MLEQYITQTTQSLDHECYKRTIFSINQHLQMIVKKTTNKKHLTQVKNTCYNICFF